MLDLEILKQLNVDEVGDFVDTLQVVPELARILGLISTCLLAK